MKKTLICLAVTLACTASFAVETRVFLKKNCPVTGAPPKPLESGVIAAAFLANVVGSLVSTGMDAIAKALGDNVLTTQRALTRSGNWYLAEKDGGARLNPEIGCLVAVISDEMLANGEKLSAAQLAVLEDSLKKLPLEIEPNLRLANHTDAMAELGLTRAPILYFEAKFATTSIAPVFSLEPSYISYPKFFGGKVPLGKEDRDVALTIEFSTVAGDFASVPLSFTNLKEGALNTARISSTVLPWMNMPSTEGMKFVNSKAVPFNVEFSITETAKPGVLGKALSGAISASKDEIKQLAETKVKLAVSASERQAARSAAAAAANTALAAYVAAFAEWEAAKDALAKVTTGNAAAKKKAQLTVDVRESMLKNAESAAKDALENAGIPFSPIPTNG